MNFEEANDYCEENGGWLADIPNQESLDFLLSVNPDLRKKFMWIGANDIETVSTFNSLKLSIYILMKLLPKHIGRNICLGEYWKSLGI